VAYIPAGNLLTPIRVFRESGGFDPTLETGEDPDLCNRIRSTGYRIVEWDRIRCIHLGEPKSLAQVFRREMWHGRGVRLRYADGRVAPVVLATVLFGVLMLLAAAGLLLSLGGGTLLPASAAVLPWIVPAIYALSRAGRVRPARLPALMAVYGFYFLGRMVALPVAVLRGLRSTRELPDG
jgi:GT2 family glycosyltransferase